MGETWAGLRGEIEHCLAEGDSVPHSSASCYPEALGESSFGTIAGGDELPPSGFVTKISSAGAPIWASPIVTEIGGYPYNPVEEGLSIVVDGSNNVVVAAACTQPAHVGQVAVSPPPIVHAGAWNYLCMFSLDPLGQPRWGRAFTADWGFGSPRPKLVAGPDGNVYVAGGAGYKMDLGAGPMPTPGSEAAYVLALGSNGDVLWSRVFGGSIAGIGSLGIDAKGRLVALIIAGGDVVVAGKAIGGDAYTRRSVLVWLDPDGTVLSRRILPLHEWMDTLAVGPRGIAMLGTQDGNDYAPTLVAQCEADGANCKVDGFGEAWDLFRDVAWHPDGDIVAAGTFTRDGTGEHFAAVGKFRFE